MPRLIISEDARSGDLADLAITLNEIVRLPVTMRGAKYPGVRVENGRILDENYSGPVLEEVIKTGKAIRTIPQSGSYAGVPVSVAPLVVDKQTVAAIGIVDVIGTIDIPEVFGSYADVVRQVRGKASEEK